MAIRKMMNDADRKLFEQEIIKKYKLTHKSEEKRPFPKELFNKLKALIPVEIVIGIAASALLVYLNDVKALVNLLLFGIIWATIITAILAWLIKPKTS